MNYSNKSMNYSNDLLDLRSSKSAFGKNRGMRNERRFLECVGGL